MFANTQGGSMNLGFPDVCLTPTPVGPIPIPYPNITVSAMGVPPVPNVLFDCLPAHNMMTVVPLSMGDNAGLAGGVASGTDMGPTRHILGSFTFIVGTAPATRLTDMTIQNSTNCPGATLTPSNLTVLVLAP